MPAILRDPLRRLRPLDSASQEIRALDGLRAVAALSIVVYHTLLSAKFYVTPASQAVGNNWYYLMTGVQLFFVLSGFLLFLPYARAILAAQPLPSARRFYRRRALRILPAYWACLAFLAVLPSAVHDTKVLVPDVIAHVLMIHDAFPLFNRDFEGPFWTLAVEWQFYLLLPLLAAGIARLAGASRSVARLGGGVIGVIIAALLLRWVDAVVMGLLPQLHGAANTAGTVFVLATMGTQGKDLEVFAVGMLCSVLYVITIEERRVSIRLTRSLAYVLLIAAAIMIIIALPYASDSAAMFAPGASWGWNVIGYPLFVGLGYGALVLAALWGSRAIRAPFELAPLRFIGLISYSLYLWHLPNIDMMIPIIRSKPLVLRVVAAFVIAYLSYQFVERPFLRRRHRETRQAQPAAPLPDTAVAVPRDAMIRVPGAVDRG